MRGKRGRKTLSTPRKNRNLSRASQGIAAIDEARVDVGKVLQSVVEVVPTQDSFADDFENPQAGPSRKRKPKRKRSPTLLPTRRSKRLESIDSSTDGRDNQLSEISCEATATVLEAVVVHADVHFTHDGERAQKLPEELVIAVAGPKRRSITMNVWAESQKPGNSKDLAYMREGPKLKLTEHQVAETVVDARQHDDDVVRSLLQLSQQLDNEDQAAALLEAADAIENREELLVERERRLAEIELARDRPHQLRTYLAATNRRRDDIVLHSLGDFDRTCPYCDAKFFTDEINTRNKYTNCCSDGNVRLVPLQPLPEVLLALFKGEHTYSRTFKKDILRYNNAFQFASCEATLRGDFPFPGPFTYAIQGKIYSHIADIVIPNQHIAKYGSIYFLETDEATNRRVDIQRTLNVHVMRTLEWVLRQNNPFAQGYQTLRERYEEQRRDGVPTPTVFLQIIQSRNLKRRELDMPEANEVAAVYCANETNPPCKRLAVYPVGQNRGLRSITFYDTSADPMTFPLLFPTGELGWEIGLRHERGQRNITLCEYYAYRCQYKNDFETVVNAGKLSQQYVVSGYVKVEANSIEYILQNQNKCRAEEYVGLADYLHNRADANNLPLGRMIILPTSYVGSPRSQIQRYQDAMALFFSLGKACIFLTFTTNPRWPEIVNNIPIGDEPNDHPMLIDRVFRVKLLHMMNDIWKRHIFGVALGFVYVIEFQKRGLPHAHILVILRDVDKLDDPYRIDQLISAEIPDPNIDAELYELVKKHMVHYPCGEFNRNSVCMVDDKCKKKFPKRLSDETCLLENGSVTYRRRNNFTFDITTKQKGLQPINCQWVSAYSPYLLLKYKCHINLEACASVKSVKYLYKYLFKSADQALVKITHTLPNRRPAGDAVVAEPPAAAAAAEPAEQLEYNEVEAYLNTRYMSPPEAAWHLNKFPMHESSHTVYRLPVHLEDRQRVIFHVGGEQEAFDRNDITMLTGWFNLNDNDLEARRYLYGEIPYHYVWNRGNKAWTRRVRRNELTISRMYTISVRHREMYHLRTLLLHVRGATSFRFLRTVEDVVCDSFEEACRQRGLLLDDDEWNRCLTEATRKDMPKQLRQLFSYILVFCEVQHPLRLFETFRPSLIEDYRRRGLTEDASVQMALRHIRSILSVNGRNLEEFHLPQLIIANVPFVDDDDVAAAAAERDDEQNVQLLNEEQQMVFDLVMAAVRNVGERRRLFYLSGAGGTGKTFLYNRIIDATLNERMAFVAVAWTGMASNLIRFGRTVHSRFKLPVPTKHDSVSQIKPNSLEGEFLRNVRLIVWDEISNTERVAFDLVDRTMRDVCQNDLPFGGKTVLVGGDFRQCLPIVQNGERTDIMSVCVKQSNLWRLFEKLELHVNVRAADDNTGYAEWLLHLGNNTLDGYNRSDYKLVVVPPECLLEHKDALIKKVFPNIRPYDVPNKAILTPLNKDCSYINDLMCDKFPGLLHTYASADSVIEDDEHTVMANYPIEFLNSLTPNGCPPHRLLLKQGMIVMVLRNINLRKGICNGTRCLITSLAQNFIEVQIINGKGRLTDQKTFIPRIDFIPIDSNLPFKMRRRQFPIKLAYCSTINKSQGQTYDSVGIYLRKPVFTHGQLYVAFSRAKRRDSVFAVVEPSTAQGKLFQVINNFSTYTKNVVYPEALE